MAMDERFNKRQKDAHRFRIADTRGPLELTVPIAKPYGKTWADTRISDHGSWHETIPAALESAYSRTPYFEFYAPDLLPLFSSPQKFKSVAEMNQAVNKFILTALLGPSSNGSNKPLPFPRPNPTYRQIRDRQLGFIPNLSILDALFNIGPETLLLL